MLKSAIKCWLLAACKADRVAQKKFNPMRCTTPTCGRGRGFKPRQRRCPKAAVHAFYIRRLLRCMDLVGTAPVYVYHWPLSICWNLNLAIHWLQHHRSAAVMPCLSLKIHVVQLINTHNTTRDKKQSWCSPHGQWLWDSDNLFWPLQLQSWAEIWAVKNTVN